MTVISEPWLRGILPDVDPVIGHLIRSCDHIREDLARALSGLSAEEIAGAVGFHARHLAGSTLRLCAYLEGRALTDSELAAMANEGEGVETAGELISRVDDALNVYERQLRSLKPADFGTVRYVGRARLPVTAIGLAIHIAEHGQRHVGQALVAAKLGRAQR